MCLHSCTVRGCTVFRNELFCVVDNPEYEKQVGTAGQRNINSLGLLMKNFSAMPLTHQAVYSYLHNLDVEPRRYVCVLFDFSFYYSFFLLRGRAVSVISQLHSEEESREIQRQAEKLRGTAVWEDYWKTEGVKHQVYIYSIYVLCAPASAPAV